MIDAASKAVMIVDDESDICFVFKKALELAGYEVYGFTNPALALEHFRSNIGKYGLIVSDVRMPIMNGIEMATKVRELDQSIPIMLMSAFDMATLNIEPALSIAKLLEKPLAPSQLVQFVSKYVGVPAK